MVPQQQLYANAARQWASAGVVWRGVERRAALAERSVRAASRTARLAKFQQRAQQVETAVKVGTAATIIARSLTD